MSKYYNKFSYGNIKANLSSLTGLKVHNILVVAGSKVVTGPHCIHGSRGTDTALYERVSPASSP